MLNYASMDSYYLFSLAKELRKNLRTCARLDWVEEECEILSKVRYENNNHNPFFFKFKGARKLDSKSLSLLEAILQFRDKKAKGRDVPHFKVLGNKPILELAEKKPLTEQELLEIDGISPKLVNSLGSSLLKIIEKSERNNDELLPLFPRKSTPYIGASARLRIKALKNWRIERGQEIGIDPSLIFTNAQIQSIATAFPKRPDEMKNLDGIRRWQRLKFGREVCDIIKNHI